MLVLDSNSIISKNYKKKRTKSDKTLSKRKKEKKRILIVFTLLYLHFRWWQHRFLSMVKACLSLAPSTWAQRPSANQWSLLLRLMVRAVQFRCQSQRYHPAMAMVSKQHPLQNISTDLYTATTKTRSEVKKNLPI